MKHEFVLKPKRAAQKAAPAPQSAPPSAQPAPVGVPRFLRRTAETAREGRSGMPSEHVHLPSGQAVKVYDNAASRRAAGQMGAYAYTWGGDIFMGAGLGLRGAPTRQQAIEHELVHAKQTRNRGARAATSALEAEAYGNAANPRLTADPETPLGLWWVIPVAAGLYVLLRPNVANAPGPGDKTYPSVSEAQVAGEALALFAVPTGVAGMLGRAGYGIIASTAIGGATSAVSYRGVQDVGAGEFSGVEAYVVDATTGAVIGAVIGGVFRPFASARSAASQTPRPDLVHFTSQAGHQGISSSNVLRGSQGIYTLPSSATSHGTAGRFARTLVNPSNTSHYVNIPRSATPLFSQPTPIGPISLYQRLAGVYRAPAGSINMLTGEFTASTNRFANITGQFWPYGVDAMIWGGAITTGVTLSPRTEGSFDRGITSPFYSIMAAHPDQPIETRSDGPFIMIDPAMLNTEPDASSEDIFPYPIMPFGDVSAQGGGMPAIIFIEPNASVLPQEQNFSSP